MSKLRQPRWRPWMGVALLVDLAFLAGFYTERYLHRAIVVKMDVVCHVPSVNTAPANVTRL